MGDVSPGSMGIIEGAPAMQESGASFIPEKERLSIPAPPLTSPYEQKSLTDTDDVEPQTIEEKEEELIASKLHRALNSCSWKALCECLIALQDTPQKLIPVLSDTDTEHQSTVLHTSVWKAPPPLTKFILDLLAPLNDADTLFMARDMDGNTPLHLCCANLPITNSGSPDTGVMKRLAEAAPHVLQMGNSQGDTPLHMLVSSSLCCVTTDDQQAATVSKEAVSCLLALSEDIAYLQDSTGATPLHTAIASGANEWVLFQLFETAPSVAKVPDERGMLPLHYAAAFGHTPLTIVELLVEAYPDAITEVTVNGDTPLHLLASNAYLNRADLLTHRMDVDTEKIIGLLTGSERDEYVHDSENEDGKQKPLLVANAEKMNPLHCCALFNAPSQLSRLLMKIPHGVQAATKTNDFGATPLHVACAQPGVAESVSQVASLGTAAAAAIQDRHKRTPLHVAAQNSYATGDLIKVLTNLYPEASMEMTQRGHVPLHLAAQSQASESVIKALIKANTKAAEARNKSNNTPLHDAAKYRASAGVVRILLETYPDAVYIQNQYGNLPLHCATAYQAPSEVVTLLLEAWPDGAAMQNRNQDAPLHYAAAYTTSLDVLRPLIAAAPAAVLLLNSSGQSPIDRAKANNAPEEIVRQLEESANEWTKKASMDGWGSFASIRADF